MSLEERLGRLEARLADLEDRAAILRTMYDYGHALDYGERDTFSECWNESAVLHWPRSEKPIAGREMIMKAFDDHSHAPQAFHKHLLCEPRIVLAGNTATADSMFARMDRLPDEPYVSSFGRYLDRLSRCPDGRWRFDERIAELEARRWVTDRP